MKNEYGCPMWDEFNECCMKDRVETIVQLDGDNLEHLKKWEPVNLECMEEMP
jgi:hypothetical protein